MAVVALLVAAFAAWNFALFIRPYGAADYPERPWRWGLAVRGYPHNVLDPYRQVGRDLDQLLGSQDRFLDDMDGSFSVFYYKDQANEYQHTRRAGTLGTPPYSVEWDARQGCCRLLFDSDNGVRAVVTRRTLCPSQVESQIDYPGSRIRLYLLRLRREAR
jgi:hypothetical protein